MVSPVLRGANHDFPAVKAGVVKGVHGLAVFQHHIVCDVDYIIDGTHAGRRADADASNVGEGSILIFLTILPVYLRAESGIFNLNF